MLLIHKVLLVLATTAVRTQGQGQIVVSFIEQKLTVSEGAQFEVQIAKSAANEKAFLVYVEVENDLDEDFVGTSQVARFDRMASGVAVVSFTVKDDDIPEAAEVYYLHLVSIDKNILVGSPSRLQVIISANDDAYGVFSLNEVSPMMVTEYSFVSEVQIKVKREVSFYDTVVVNYTVSSNSSDAVLGVDILPATGTVTFQPLQKEASIGLQILPDDIPENNESFFVTLTSASFNARVASSILPVIITANDAPVRITKAEYRFDEGPGTKIVIVQVTRGIMADGTTQIGSVNVQVSVDYNFIPVAATFEDFTATNGTLIFLPGETTKNVSFVIIDDAIPELEENFSLRLLNLQGSAVFVTPSVATVIISANDNPSGNISFKANSSGGPPSQRVNEDSFTSVNFVVVRAAGTFGDVSVSWFITRDSGDSATVTDDIGPATGKLVFVNGTNEAVLSLTVVQDNTPEPAEMFIIHLQPQSVTGNAVVEGYIDANLLIEDSDNLYGTVEFGPDNVQKLIVNQTPRLLQLSLTRSGGHNENLIANVTVTYSDGTPNVENDTMFVTSSKIITLLTGVDPTTVTFELRQSTFLVIGGKFQATIIGLALQNVPKFGAYNSPRLGIRKQITVSVTLKEANGETGLFNVTNQIVDEPVTGITKVGLLVSREGLSGQANVRWSISGVDVTSDDVEAMQGILVLQPGVSEALLVIGIKADDIPEVAEYLKVQLVSIEPSDTQRLRPGFTTVIITINSNDNPGGVIQFSPAMNHSYTVTEGGDPIEVIVERTGGDLVQSEVQYSIFPNGTDEFYGATNILVFNTGGRTASSLILAKKDGIPELSEDYTLSLKLVGGSHSVLGSRTSIEITISGNDYPYGIIQFPADPTKLYTVEGQAGEQINVTIAVQRSSGTYGQVTVPWTITPTGQDDLLPPSGIIIFEPGQNTQNISLTVKNDDVPEGNETYAVQLSTPQGGALSGIPMVATIVILENDNPVEFVDPVVYAMEPQTINLVIRRQGRLDKQGKVYCRTIDGSASYLERDYNQMQTLEITFDVGQQDKVVSVTVLDDDIPEGNETFSVQLFDVGGDLITTNKSTATILIMANDQAYGVFSFTPPSAAQVDEGNTVFFDVIRNRGNFGTVRVHWELRSQNSIPLVPGDDFQVTSGQMDFSSQENRRPLGISPIADNIPEVVELFLLVLTKVEATSVIRNYRNSKFVSSNQLSVSSCVLQYPVKLYVVWESGFSANPVLNGITNGNLASLAITGTIATVRVTVSDDPYGSMAFAAGTRDLKIAEDFYPGSENSTQALITVERRQGTQNEVMVLWEIFSDQLGANLPRVHDLLFSGQWPSSVLRTPVKQRAGTTTNVAQFSGSSGQYITVPFAAWPSLTNVSDGFSLSAWLQPFLNADGYVVAYCSDNGAIHFVSLRITVTPTKTSLVLTISTQLQINQQLNVESSAALGDGQWHHILVAVGNAVAYFYLDGQLMGSRTIVGSAVLNGSGVALVGAQPPGSDLYTGYMQDVRVFMRAMDANSVNELYQTMPHKEITVISGVLTYSSGISAQNFTVASRQDIEEEGREVFAVILLDTTGGASLAIPDSRTTLTIMKSDNANGLFGFNGQCDPARVLYENGTVTCTVQRIRGDDGTVTVFWIVYERQGQTLQQATADFNESNGTVVFLPGERNKTLVLRVTDETVPELDELFDVQLTAVASDDGLVGSTNTSGASIDSTRRNSQIVIQENDYPYGLLQFSNQRNLSPPVNVMIMPATQPAEISVSEESGIVPLPVYRAQGLLGSVRVEWRTKDITARSEGKSPIDYVGGVGSITMASGVNSALVNITIKDNNLPEAEKKFEVELFSPSGGAALGRGARAVVTIQPSDGAFGVFQFADTSLDIKASENGDEGFNIVSLQVLRLSGSIGNVSVSWIVQENDTDGLDIINQSGNVTFQPDDTSHVLDLQIQGDTIPELDETILVKLLTVSAVRERTRIGQLGDSLKTTATVVIAANDDPYGKFVITSAFRPKSVLEIDQDVDVIVQRLGGKYGSVLVDFTTLYPNETYLFLPGPVIRAGAEDFYPANGTLSFGSDQEFADFKVHIIDDQVPEQDESVFVRLTSVRLVQAAQLTPVAASPRLGQDTDTYGQIVISNNDDAGGRLLLQPSNITVDETIQTLAVNVVRTGGTFGEVSVAFSIIDGTAVQNMDYDIKSTIVILASGESTKRVPVDIIDDRLPELYETFTIQLLNKTTGGAVVGDQNSTVVTILPSDDPNGLFEFVSSGQSVEERSQAYSVDITVFRMGGFIDVVTIAWTATLNGQPALEDISPVEGFLYFVTNEAERKITLTVLPDNVPEGPENIVITLVNATNGGRIGQKNTFSLTIAQNDSPYGTVELSAAAYYIPEDTDFALTQTAQIVRRGGTFGTLRVYYSTLAMNVLDLINTGDIKPLELFEAPLKGIPAETGSQVDVSQSSDMIQSCASACLYVSSCNSFSIHQKSTGVLCYWYSKAFAPSSLQTTANDSYYEMNRSKLSNVMANQAKGGEDFTVVAGQFVLIGDGQTLANIPIPVIDDQLPEPDETFYLVLTDVLPDDGTKVTSDSPLLGQLKKALIIIRANDNAFGVFRLYSSSAGPNVRVIEVNEVDKLSVDLIVERNGGSMGSVSVDWSVSTINRTATYGQDYIADGATLTFSAGQITRAIAVTILDDTVAEDNEELTIQLTNSKDGSTISSMNAIRIVILANDNAAGVLSFEKTSLLMNEGDKSDIKVRRSLPALGRVTATWLIEGRNGLQAAQGFALYNGSLTFLPNETEKSISLSTLSDDTPEVNEEYSLTLQNITTQGLAPSGAASLDPRMGSVLLTIAESNDPHGVFQLAQSSLEFRVLENVGTANLTVVRQFGAIGAVRVTYEATQGSIKPLGTQRNPAYAGEDFVAVLAGITDFGNGVTSGIISVTIIDDNISEIDEVFVVRLTGVSLIVSSDTKLPPRLAPNETEAEVIIIANDGAQGIIQFAPDSINVSVAEQGQTISLTVVRGSGTFGQVSVYVYSQAVTKSALLGQDYNMTNGELVFANGEARKSIMIVILDDNEPEPAEIFQVILANSSIGGILGQEITATITILPNDQAGGVITFETVDPIRLWEPTATNSTGSQVDILLRRGPGVFGVVSVPFNITTSLGQPAPDVSPQFGTVTFPDGQSTTILSITAVNDDIPEAEETFILTLQTPTGLGVLGDLKTRTIIISASDSPFGLLQIFIANTRKTNYSVEETFSTLEFDIVRSQGTQGQVTVDVMTVPVTATYSVNTSRVVLAPISQAVGLSVSDWCQVTVNGTVYLLMLTSLTSDTQLASILPNGSSLGVGQSVIYKWQGQLTYTATLSSDGAAAAVSFTINNITYVCVANSGKEGKHQVSSPVYRFNQGGIMQLIQNLSTSGASDVEHFVYNSKHFLFVTNSLDDTSKSDINSSMFEWNPDLSSFSSSPKQQVPTMYAQAVISFTIDNQTFVAIANYYNRSANSFEISSTVYRMESNFTLVKYQELATQGAMSLTFTVAGGMQFLSVANNRQNRISTPQDSAVYRWESVNKTFVLHQTLKTSRAQKVTSVITDTGSSFLVFANSVVNSEIFIWDGPSRQFISAWKGAPYLSLQPITVQQSSGTMYLLASAGVNQEPPNFFQIAQLADGSDFVPRNMTMTFDPNQTLLRSSVVILTDDIPEELEAFVVTLTSPTGGAELGPMKSVTVSILTNDDAHGIIEFAQDSLIVFVEERNNADTIVQLNVTRRMGIYGHVTVSWTATRDQIGDGDITPLSGQVEFANGQSAAIVTMTVRDDKEPESAEVTYVSLVQVDDSQTDVDSKKARLGVNVVSKVTVLANDSPYGVVSWEKPSVTVVEPEGTDQEVYLAVIRQQGLEKSIKVDFVTSTASQLPLSQQATPDKDYVSRQDSVTFAEGVTRAMIYVVIKQDNMPEEEETFLVNLTSVTVQGASPGLGGAPSIVVGQGVMQVIISSNDNAGGIVQMDVKTNVEGRFDVYEEYGNNVTIELPLKRLEGIFGLVTVTWQANHISTTILDFYPTSGTVNFVEKQRNASIFITIVDDTLQEDLETFDVKLISITGNASLGLPNTVTVAILKNDSPTGLFRFATSQVETQESKNNTDPNGQARAVVQRVQGTQGLVNVQWRLNAEAASDFLPPLEGKVTFSNGESQKAILLQTRPDTILEGREEFVVSLVAADNNADISSTDGNCRIIILADAGSSGIISILSEYRSLFVGEAGESDPNYTGRAEVKLTRGQGIYGQVAITWSLTPRDLSAFLQVEGSLQFLDLQQTASIVLQIRDDDVPELRQTFILQITSASGGAVVSDVAGEYTANIVFVASDYPHGLIQFTLPQVEIVSEDQAIVHLMVVRGKGLVGQLSVAYSTFSGNATAYNDFLPSAGNLTFLPGVSNQTIDVRIVPDTLPEGPEDFFVNLTSVQIFNDNNNYTLINGLSQDMLPALGPLSTKVVRIDKNDNAEGTIQFSNDTYEVKEESGLAQVLVVRTGGTYGQVSVHYTTSMVTATEGMDYLATTGDLIMQDGIGEKAINITIRDDSDMEPNETFKIILSNVAGGALLGTKSTATVTILKSDYPNGRFAFQGPSELRLPNPPQPTNKTLIVERTGGVLGQQQVFWRIMGPNNPGIVLESTSDISSISGGNELTYGSFTWENGTSGTRQLMLNIKPYTSWEVEKSFVVALYKVSGLPPGVGDGQVDTNQGQVVIKIDRFGDPNGIIQFTDVANQNREVPEPDGVTPTSLLFPLIRQTGTGVIGDVRVYWEVRPNSANNTDIQLSSGSVLLPDGTRNGQIVLQILPDDVPELTENFSLILVRVEGGAQIDLQFSQSNFSISYNDHPHGEFGVISQYQTVEVSSTDMMRKIRLNFTRFQGTFGSVILTFTVQYDDSTAGVGLDPSTGNVTFNNGDSQVYSPVRITGNGFLRLNSTFTVYVNGVQFLGPGVTEDLKVRSGFSKAQITVPALAANTELSFASDLAIVNEGDRTLTVTLMRVGTYGKLDAEWVSGNSSAARSSIATNGEVNPVQGTVKMAHGQDMANITVQITPKVGMAETFVLRLPGSPLSVVSGSLVSGQARLAASRLIVQVDPSGLIRFSDASLTAQVSELDGQLNLTIWRLYGSNSRVAIHYQTLSNTSIAGLDFKEVTAGVVIMEPLQTIANITLQIIQDNQPEPMEIFYVNLTSVEKFPTPVQPVLSPRVSLFKSLSQISIKESNDPYGILFLRPTQITIKEAFTTVSLAIARTGGLFGAVNVTVRTVGGGENWTTQITPKSGSTTNDTIADMLGKRTIQETATAGLDYNVLNSVVTLQAQETEKIINVTILEDGTPEPVESVLVYLTQATIGARIAEGSSDGGLKGYAVINIAASDFSNGLIGFDENSKNVHVNEDTSARVTLKLIRLNAFYGEVKVNWKAKKSLNSTDLQDADVSSQINTTVGFTLCPPDQSLCDLDVDLKNDNDPEESYTFVIVLLSAETDAKLNEDSMSAMVTIDPSDDVNGLVQFTQNSRVLIVGENEPTIHLGVERLGGQAYDVSVNYNTQQMTTSVIVSGVTVSPALVSQDFRGKTGSLLFMSNQQEVKYIFVNLTSASSNNPLPKQFSMILSSPSNGARIHPQLGTATVRIVKREDISVWTTVSTLEDNAFVYNDVIISVISQLEQLAEKPVSNDGLSIIEDVLGKVNSEGNKKKYPIEVVTVVRNLYCKLMEATIGDARSGRTSLVEKLEGFADTLVTNATCPPVNDYYMISTECANVKISAGRWTSEHIAGHTFNMQSKDKFIASSPLPQIGTAEDGTNDQCVDFHLLEYSSQTWFKTTTNNDVLHGRIVGFGLKGRQSAGIQFPVKYTIHTPDRRIAAKNAKCVYFDEASEKWVSPADVCKVTNDLRSGSDDFVDCECSHMSSYAVVSATQSDNIIGYVKWFFAICFVCMAAMVITVVVHHLCFSKTTFSASIHMHSLMAIFFTQMCLVIDAYLSPDDILAKNEQEDNSKCIAMGLFLHYFFLTQFAWIATQAVNLWKVLIGNDEHTDRFYVIFFVIGWGLPLIIVAIFYAVTFNIFKYHTNLEVDFIYGDVNNNRNICFITNGYSALCGILAPVFLTLLVVGIVFVRAYQLSSQWYFYDDVYHGRVNLQEIPFLLIIWAILLLTNLWLALHMIFGYLWLMVLFCIFNSILALIVFILYAIIRNPLLAFIFGPVKASYSVNGEDRYSFSSPAPDYNQYAPTSSVKGSRTTLLNESWENSTDGRGSRMTVKRAHPSQVYMNPPVAIISPAATINSDNLDFDDLIYSLKLGRSLTPSEFSRSFDDDLSQLSIVLDHYETRRIDIADTHV